MSPGRLTGSPARLVLALVVASSCKGGGAAGENDGTRALREEVPKVIAEADRLRRRGLAEAETTAAPRPDLGPCAALLHELPAGSDPESTSLPARIGPTMLDAPPYDAGRGDGPGPNANDELLGLEQLGVAQASEVGSKPGPLAFRLEASLRSPKSDHDAMTARRLRQRASEGQDVELVIDEEVLPREREPGRLRGRLYVWDYGRGAIVCAARAGAESPPETSPDAGEPPREREARLRSNLRERAIESAKSQLSAAGPPPARK